jgi:protein SCO1
LSRFVRSLARAVMPAMLLFGAAAPRLALAAPPPLTETTSVGKSSAELPRQLVGVGYDQKLGQPLPLDVALSDEAGKKVRLGDFFGTRPVVFALAYYRCPMLCTLVLDGLASTLKVMNLEPGKDFDVVIVSFDPADTATSASEMKKKVVHRYNRKSDGRGWHFLTGDAAAIRRVTEAVGFRYRYDPQDQQFAHAAGLVIMTPAGKIARYFYGIEYAPRDVRLGLVEAADNRIGTVVDQVLLYCFHYDPAVGKYSAATFKILKAAGAITVVGLAVMVALLRRQEKKSLRTA